MDATQIVIRPLITEKATWESTTRNRYTFVVHPEATKPEIKDAVQSLYKVRVQSVATTTRKGKERRNKFGKFTAGGFKKATVHLHPEDRIDLF